MVTILALVSAILYGTADFLGGAGSRRVPVLSLLAVSAPAGTVLMILAALLAGGAMPAPAALAWGAAGGIAGGLGLIGFYAGLAAAPMSVVAPVSALVATLLPVGVALRAGERPGLLVIGGAAACLAAIVLVSTDPTDAPRQPGARPARRGLLYGIAAGAGFGLFFILVRNAAHVGHGWGGLWPLVMSRAAGTLVVLVAAAATRDRMIRWTADRVAALMALGCGVLDAAANVFYVLAIRHGLFSLAVVITSLYPAMTVLLARVVLGERMRALQQAGLALAALGIVLVTA
jgi:drug/metabolite transporter (DMT)-like permease